MEMTVRSNHRWLRVWIMGNIQLEDWTRSWCSALWKWDIMVFTYFFTYLQVHIQNSLAKSHKEYWTSDKIYGSIKLKSHLFYLLLFPRGKKEIKRTIVVLFLLLWYASSSNRGFFPLCFFWSSSKASKMLLQTCSSQWYLLVIYSDIYLLNNKLYGLGVK